MLLVLTDDNRIEATYEDSQGDTVMALYPGRKVVSYSGPSLLPFSQAPGGSFVPTKAPADASVVPSNDGVTVLKKIDLFRRATDDEADAIDGAFSQTTTRLRNIFASALELRSDAEEWPVLRDNAIRIFGQERADVLLAPST